MKYILTTLSCMLFAFSLQAQNNKLLNSPSRKLQLAEFAK